MTWALNAYTLAFGGLLLLGGRMGDILGRRKMFIVGLALFTPRQLPGRHRPNFALLLVGRAIQGVGGAIASPTALSLITTEFEEGEERNRALGVYAAVSGAGAALGLLLGGILTEYLSWRWVLFVNVPIGIVLMIGAFLLPAPVRAAAGPLRLPRRRTVGRRHGRDGLRLHPRGAHRLEQPARRIAVFAAAAILLVGFVYFEAKVARDPMMPMRIFENRNRSGAYLIMLVVGAAMFGMFYFVTFFVQGVHEFSAVARPASRSCRSRSSSASRPRSSARSCCPDRAEAADDHRHDPADRGAAVVLDGRRTTRVTAGTLLPGHARAGGRRWVSCSCR